MTSEEKEFLDNYVADLESNGHEVHYAPRDVDQSDPHGIKILSEHRDKMKITEEVHIYWKPKSQGSKFDFGMAFILDKPIKLINRAEIKPTPHKSFENALLFLDEQYRKDNE